MLHYSGNQQIWSYLQAGRLDAAPYTAMPANVLSQVLAAGNTRIDTPSLVAASLAFDQATYPYGLLAVRQALAYLDQPAVRCRRSARRSAACPPRPPAAWSPRPSVTTSRRARPQPSTGTPRTPRRPPGC